MNNKTNCAIALKNIGVSEYEIQKFMKSQNEYYVKCVPSKLDVRLYPERREKLRKLAERRHKIGVEVIGAIFRENVDIEFLFYKDNNPKKVFYDRVVYDIRLEFDKDLEENIAEDFSPNIEVEGLRVMYNKALQIPEGMFSDDIPIIYLNI